jgi:hypothetical protein
MGQVLTDEGSKEIQVTYPTLKEFGINAAKFGVKERV